MLVGTAQEGAGLTFEMWQSSAENRAGPGFLRAIARNMGRRLPAVKRTTNNKNSHPVVEGAISRTGFLSLNFYRKKAYLHLGDPC